MEQLINEFTKQLEILKANKVEQYSQTKNIVAADTYEMVLQEKSRLAQELMTLKGMYDEAQEKIRTMYDLEEQLKSAVFKAGQCVEECNMLKGRLVVLETKELLDGSVDD